MGDRRWTHQAITAEWAAYGVRDAVVFTVGFVLALVLIVPFA